LLRPSTVDELCGQCGGIGVVKGSPEEELEFDRQRQHHLEEQRRKAAAERPAMSRKTAPAPLPSNSAQEKRVSGVCDICNRPTATTSGATVFKNLDMKRATERGFNGLAIGPNARMLAFVGIATDETIGQWKRKVMLDTTDWLLCPECQKEIRKYT
jgi:hypothetical protein